jgi:hypothetical protein
MHFVAGSRTQTDFPAILGFVTLAERKNPECLVTLAERNVPECLVTLAERNIPECICEREFGFPHHNSPISSDLTSRLHFTLSR